MEKKTVFTFQGLQRLKLRDKPYKVTEYAAKGEGRLMVRVLPSGVLEFFYRYRAAGMDKTLGLGRYKQSQIEVGTLKAINDKLRQKREKQRETGDVKEAEEREELARAAALAEEQRQGTLQQLLQAYVSSLRVAGKVSASEAENIFRAHVLERFPVMAKKLSKDIDSTDIRRILNRMVKAGITRQVNKARAYLRAAFAYGMASDSDPLKDPDEGLMFSIKAQPVISKPIKHFERTSDRVLAEEELRAYWKALPALPVPQAATLRVNLALACQRPTQLLRAAWDAFDFSENTLLLRDPKGKGKARDHLLPLTPLVLEHLEPLRQRADPFTKNPPAFTSNGKVPLTIDTLSEAVSGISRKLEKANSFQPFGQRDLRRTAETMLQRLGIDREVRAHLLSHGRTKGSQGKHYERYDFLKEKREALEKWSRHLERITEGKEAKVIAMPQRA